jgi:TonB-dependent starch-binding outer membrane protein SusC
VSSAFIEWLSRGTLQLERSQIVLPAGYPPYRLSDRWESSFVPSRRIEHGKSPTRLVAALALTGAPQVVGERAPGFRIGWANQWRVGGLTVGVLLDWQHGGDVVNIARIDRDAEHTSPDVEAAAARLAAWQESLVPDMRPYIEDASFVKLREVSISYDLPKRYAAKLGPLKTLQLSASGRDLATFTSYSGLDPEVANTTDASSAVYDVSSYHPSRSYWFTITAGI